MTLALYGHPFSSYTQKALIALYENATPFEFRVLDGSEPHASDFEALWPIKRFPILVDKGLTILESTIVIEHLGLHHPGPVRLIPADVDEALEVRKLDRFFDNYVMRPMQKMVFDSIRPADVQDSYGVGEARAMLDRAYGWLDDTMAAREWAAGDEFSLADCAAAPFLFYADWTHPIGAAHPNVAAYRQRLLRRPSFARAVDEARPYRNYFPLGAPDRD